MDIVGAIVGIALAGFVIYQLYKKYNKDKDS